jgi:uncharacterized membrane protein YhaH (DUF805 family)
MPDMTKGLDLYFSGQGRIGRGVYALAFLVLTVVAVVVALLVWDLTASPRITNFNRAQLVVLCMIYPFWALSTKRAHDLGRSGLWVAGWYAAALTAAFFGRYVAVFAVVGMVLPVVGLPLLIGGVALSGVVIWKFFIKLFLCQGDACTNQYGSPRGVATPLFRDDTDAAPSTTRAAERTSIVPMPAAPQTTRMTTPNMRPGSFGRRTT